MDADHRPPGEPLIAVEKRTLDRLDTVEDHLQHIQATLDVIDRFNERLDNIHALLEVAIGFVSADTDIEGSSSFAERGYGGAG